jgi:uncharacterized protein YbaR (Trm112 family)
MPNLLADFLRCPNCKNLLLVDQKEGKKLKAKVLIFEKDRRGKVKCPFCNKFVKVPIKIDTI